MYKRQVLYLCLFDHRVGAGDQAWGYFEAEASKGYPMYQILCVLMATIAYGTATGHCQGSQAGMTTVTFQSSTYNDMRQLLARETATGAVTVKAYLGFPEQVRDRYPAVVIVHTMAGYRDANEGYAAAELRKAGFATLTYDSFAARGTTGAALQGSSGYLPVGVADAYAALRLLSGEPRIDADRIAIIGFSYGGEVNQRLRASDFQPGHPPPL